jgi:hypothetical protein
MIRRESSPKRSTERAFESFTEKGRASCDGEREEEGCTTWRCSRRCIKSGRMIRYLALFFLSFRLQERTDSLAFSIYRRIHGPKLETLALSSFCELIVGGRKEARVGAWVGGLAAGDRLGVSQQVRIHLRQPSLQPCSINLA